MARGKGARMLKVASRGQHSNRGNVGPEGLWCPICSPRPWAAANRQQAADAVALDAVEEVAMTL